MRSMLVIGLGHFGRHLSVKLAEMGNEVMVVDKNEEMVNKIAPYVTQAQIGDCMETTVLRALGVGNFDICFVCISDNFQSSLEITSLLKEMGAVKVISTADRDIHAKFLNKIGADEVIFPERDMAQRTAIKYSLKNAVEHIELSPDFAIFEVRAPEEWTGKSILNLDLRARHAINVIGIKTADRIEPLPNPHHVVTKGEKLLIAGSKRDLLFLMDKRGSNRV